MTASEEIEASIRDRLGHSFFGTLAISFATWNWDAFVWMTAGVDPNLRITEAVDRFTDQGSLAIPLTFTLIYIATAPFLSAGVGVIKRVAFELGKNWELLAEQSVSSRLVDIIAMHRAYASHCKTFLKEMKKTIDEDFGSGAVHPTAQIRAKIKPFGEIISALTIAGQPSPESMINEASKFGIRAPKLSPTLKLFTWMNWTRKTDSK